MSEPNTHYVTYPTQPPPTSHAFRCKNCGFLHTSNDAAEAKHPYCCRACGAGVTFSSSGIRTIDPDNWEHLCDCSDERLDELELTKEQVHTHTPWSKAESVKRDPVHLIRTTTESLGSRDKA